MACSRNKNEARAAAKGRLGGLVLDGSAAARAALLPEASFSNAFFLSPDPASAHVFRSSSTHITTAQIETPVPGIFSDPPRAASYRNPLRSI